MHACFSEHESWTRTKHAASNQASEQASLIAELKKELEGRNALLLEHQRSCLAQADIVRQVQDELKIKEDRVIHLVTEKSGCEAELVRFMTFLAHTRHTSIACTLSCL
jgi:molybdopterin converting factor small subunit